MKRINTYIHEAFRLRDDTKINDKITIRNLDELRKIILDKYEKNPEYMNLQNIEFSGINTFWYYDEKTEKTGLFYGLDKMKIINVTGWDTKGIKSFAYMFYGCTQLEEIIGIETWDVSELKGASFMFAFCKNLKKINISHWKHIDKTLGMFKDVPYDTWKKLECCKDN